MNIIITPAILVALVACVEDVMTIEVVGDLTNTKPKTAEKENAMIRQQIVSMGLSNIITGLFGAIGGGSTIGLSMINCYQGANGRYRISGLVLSICVFIIVLGLFVSISLSLCLSVCVCVYGHMRIYILYTFFFFVLR